jgi:hypothetical protein
VCVGLAVLAGGLAWAAEKAPTYTLAVTPGKLLYDVGEAVTATATVSAPKGVVIPALQVRAWLEWGLGECSKPQTKATVDAKAAFDFGKLKTQFGYAVCAELRDGDKTLATARNFFQITDNIWKTAVISACGKYAKNQQYLDSCFANYYNVYEVFFWAPDDFLGLTPPMNAWYSGQARYHAAVTGFVNFPKEHLGTWGLKDMIAAGHTRGLRAVTYAKLTGCGPFGFEQVRRRPELAWQHAGVLDVDRDAESLAKWDDWNAQNLPVSWLAVNYNMNDNAVVDVGIKNLADSAALFGWDGARWDGNFNVAAETYDLEGKPVDKLTREQVDARNAENMRRTKAYITARRPNYVYGYNYINTSVVENLQRQPRETVECCANGGLLMNEYINHAENVNHPLHNWRRYAENMVDDTARIRALGGYMGPILGLQGNGADSQYKVVFSYAAGAHPYYNTLFNAFITRFSYYCWDPALRQVPLPETIVNVAGNVWWNRWVFTRDLDKKHRQLIVHLINPPTAAGVGEQKTLPAPQKNVGVQYYPSGLSGWKLTRVTRLDVGKLVPEPLPVSTAIGVNSVTLPDVALWNVLVLDLEKEGR